MSDEGNVSMAATVGKATQVTPGHMAAFQVEGKAVAVANVDGQLLAFDDTCTHRGCSLSQGTLDGSVVTCPCHRSRFDVKTGAVVAGPATDGLATYAVQVVRDELSIGRPGEGHGQQEPQAASSVGGGQRRQPAAGPTAEEERERARSLLANVPLFSAFDAASIESLEAFTFRRAFRSGEVIVEEGRTGNGLYVVLAGRVEVLKGLGSGRSQALAVLGPGEPFGEMALLGDWKRSASVRALEDTECLGMDRWVFLAHLRQEPQLAIKLLQLLVQRLAETNEKLVE